METIPKTDCQNIGFFRKTHGIRGELILEFEPRFELSVEDASRFFIELDGLLVPFFIEENGLRFKSGNTAIVTLKWVDTEKYAKRLTGSSVYLFKTDIVDDDAEPLESQLINYLLIDVTRGEIGIISRVDDFAGNVVITVNYRGREILIPYNDNLLQEVDEFRKTIKLKLPDGLIEI